MKISNQGTLTEEQLAAYHRDGYIVVEHLYPAEQMLHWKERIQSWVNESSSEDTRKLGQLIFWADSMDEQLFQEMHKPMTPILQQIIGFEVDLLSTKTVFKSPSITQYTHWHQDWHYWKGSNKISVWIALDNATPENGCLKMVPGSHHKYITHDAIVAEENNVTRLNEEMINGLPVVSLPIERGGAVFFSDLTLHASHPNSIGQDRWSLIPTYRNGAEPDNATVWKSFRRVPKSGD